MNADTGVTGGFVIGVQAKSQTSGDYCNGQVPIINAGIPYDIAVSNEPMATTAEICEIAASGSDVDRHLADLWTPPRRYRRSTCHRHASASPPWGDAETSTDVQLNFTARRCSSDDR
ncbi:MAG: hypothetical protein ACI9MR_005206 [Myxococcota bacterium]